MAERYLGDWLKDAPESLLRDLADLFVHRYANAEDEDPSCQEAWYVLHAINPACKYIELKKPSTGPLSPDPWCWLKGTD